MRCDKDLGMGSGKENKYHEANTEFDLIEFVDYHSFVNYACQHILYRTFYVFKYAWSMCFEKIKCECIVLRYFQKPIQA